MARSKANRKPKFWKKVEEHLNNIYPKYIVNILHGFGFDNKASLKCVNENALKIIESLIKTKPHLLEKTPYEKELAKNDDFKFLLGHKLLFTNIGRFREEIDKDIKIKKSEALKKVLKN